MAFEAINNSGPWLLLRGENDLLRPSGDVDILVAKDQLPGLDASLKSVGFSRVLAPGHGSHRFYFSYSEAEDFWLKLDIVCEISFGPYQQWRSSLAEQCLKSRVWRAPFWLPAPADQAWLQLLHLSLDKGAVNSEREELARTSGEVASVNDEMAKSVDRYMGAGIAAELLSLARSDRLAGFPATASRMGAAWTARQSLRPVIWAYLNRILRTISPVVQGRHGRGLVVGVMGPDGAGKTSLMRNLTGTLPIGGNYVYMGLWSTGPLDAVLQHIPGGRLGKKVLRILRGSLVSRYHRLRGRLVLLDRLPHDARLPGSMDLTLGGRISAALAFALSPEPEIILVLDAPGEVMFARKGEHSVEVLEAWRRAYLELARGLPSTWILDASQPQSVVRRKATAIVWSALSGGPEPARRERRIRGESRHA